MQKTGHLSVYNLKYSLQIKAFTLNSFYIIGNILLSTILKVSLIVGVPTILVETVTILPPIGFGGAPL